MDEMAEKPGREAVEPTARAGREVEEPQKKGPPSVCPDCGCPEGTTSQHHADRASYYAEWRNFSRLMPGIDQLKRKVEILLKRNAEHRRREALTFRRFQAANVSRTTEAFNHELSGWSLLEWAGAAAGELGEAANICKKLGRQAEGIDGSWSARYPDARTLRRELADEIGDTLAYLSLLASAAGLDLAECAARKFDHVSERVGWGGDRLHPCTDDRKEQTDMPDHDSEPDPLAIEAARELRDSVPEAEEGLIARMTVLQREAETFGNRERAELRARAEKEAEGLRTRNAGLLGLLGEMSAAWTKYKTCNVMYGPYNINTDHVWDLLNRLVKRIDAIVPPEPPTGDDMMPSAPGSVLHESRPDPGTRKGRQ